MQKPGVYEADKAVLASFKSDATFSVSEDSKIIAEGTWALLESEFGFFVSLEPRNLSYLNGSIGVCDNELISDARPWDEPAYMFIKMY